MKHVEVKRVGWSSLALIALSALGLAACGEDAPSVEPPAPAQAGPARVPDWANVSPEQIEEARKHRLSVAFENEWGMRLVLVPAGRFLMGAPEGGKGPRGDERRHTVRLTRPFYIQTTEVTNGQYRKWFPTHDSGEYKGYSLNGDDQPVANVSWDQAMAFARRLSLSRRVASRTYRLPTEAEWEYACRTGMTARYPWGDDPSPARRYANACDMPTHLRLELASDAHDWDDGYRVSAPVGSFDPNSWGLYDMLGNVAEWCHDWYRTRYPTGEVTDPVGPSEPEGYPGYRVLRGGSWYYMLNLPTHRDHAWPDEGKYTRGFRLVMPIPLAPRPDGDG